VRIEAAQEGTVSARFLHRRRARTAIGIDRYQRLLLLVVEQNGYSAGVTIEELARLLRRLGAVEALNLDGGSSSALCIRGLGCFGSAHPVASALAIVRKRF
jgi:exopolysaccharide biosynthesis protein